MITILLFLAINGPVYGWTPGHMCTRSNPDFLSIAYKPPIPICRRHVTPRMRVMVLKRYSIPTVMWSRFVIDHRVSICAGGSNAIDNLWPQPKEEAVFKDNIEKSVCSDLRYGKITQEYAVARLMAWPWEPLEL